MSEKIVVLFPGIGYHNDKPLMYYTKKIAAKAGYEIVEIGYEFSSIAMSIKGDAEKTKEALEEGLKQATNQLKNIQFEHYDRVIFVGKSIGTAIMTRYSFENQMDVEMIVFTPIPETFGYLGACEGLLFHGSADPFCDTDMFVQLCEEMSLNYAVIPEANHSLETGDVDTDIRNLARVMSTVERIF